MNKIEAFWEGLIQPRRDDGRALALYFDDIPAIYIKFMDGHLFTDFALAMNETVMDLK